MFTGIKASRKFVMGKLEMGKTSLAASFSHQRSEAASLPSLGQNTRMELKMCPDCSGAESEDRRAFKALLGSHHFPKCFSDSSDEVHLPQITLPAPSQHLTCLIYHALYLGGGPYLDMCPLSTTKL